MKKLSIVGRKSVSGVLFGALLAVPAVLSASSAEAKPTAKVHREYKAINHHPSWSKLDDQQHGTWRKNPTPELSQAGLIQSQKLNQVIVNKQLAAKQVLR